MARGENRSADLSKAVERVRRQIEELEREEGGGGGFLRGFGLGALLGGALALIFAPRPGQQTREQLRETTITLQDRASTAAQGAKEQAGTLQEQAQDALGQVKERAQTLIATARESAPEATATPGATDREQAPAPTPTPSATTGASAAGIAAGAGTAAASQPAARSGRAEPRGNGCPPGYPIKGNQTRGGELIYHQPGTPAYEGTNPEVCFATERDAEAAGYRPPRG